MKKILWLSGHSMNGIQMPALRRIFGADVQLVERVGFVGNAEQIVRAYREGGFDDLIIVAPLSVISRVVELGVHPLWSEAVICSREQMDWETSGRYYRFARFRKIRRLAFEFDDLGPAAIRQATDTVGGEPSSSDLPGWRRTPIESQRAATIPADVMREQGRGGFRREVLGKIRQIARESVAPELLYLKPWQRDRGGDQLHPDCRVYSIPGWVETTAGERQWYHGELQPDGQVRFQPRLVVDPGTLSLEQATSRIEFHPATIEVEAGLLKLTCGEGPYKGATLKQVPFGQNKSEERLVSADGTIIGWGIMPLATRPSGTWTGTVQLRLFHEPYPPAKMVRL